MSELYIGLMSGTSVDGIDAALVDLAHPQPKLLGTHHMAFDPAFRSQIIALCQPGDNEINRLGEIDVSLGKAFAKAVNALVQQSRIKASDIRAIGSHGQTIRHHPSREFTLQIGDPNIIAAETGITTIADFRRRDIALGGQGAPLVPAFHQAVFADPHKSRAIVNIGGIANVTLLTPQQDQIIGFDTGPGNTLLDGWAEKHIHTLYDKSGEWASSGTIQTELLSAMLADPFFKLIPPKSTGREYFNFAWLEKFAIEKFRPADVQATLVELTAKSILLATNSFMISGELLICGGGAHNHFLLHRLKELAPHYCIDTTEKFGIHPNWVESIAFAWLAQQTMHGKPGNISSVTGAKRASVLGGVYYA